MSLFTGLIQVQQNTNISDTRSQQSALNTKSRLRTSAGITAPMKLLSSKHLQAGGGK